MDYGEGKARPQGSVALKGDVGGNLALSDKIGQPGVLYGGSGKISSLGTAALTGSECAHKIATASGATTGLAPMTAGTVLVAPVNQGDTQPGVQFKP